jgi:hypothetical protein
VYRVPERTSPVVLEIAMSDAAVKVPSDFTVPRSYRNGQTNPLAAILGDSCRNHTREHIHDLRELYCRHAISALRRVGTLRVKACILRDFLSKIIKATWHPVFVSTQDDRN